MNKQIFNIFMFIHVQNMYTSLLYVHIRFVINSMLNNYMIMILLHKNMGNIFWNKNVGNLGRF